MIPELGHFALILALCLAIVQTFFPILGAHKGRANWMAVARPAAAGQWVFMTLAFACLTYAFIINDFSVAYVAGNSNTALPIEYRISAVWGGHEGSLLLWGLILSSWTLAVAIFSRTLPQEMAVRVIGVMGFVSIGFLLFMILTSNPFDRLFPAPLEGRDLNPLLQDLGLIVHPPLLYMGYVGLSVAFGFAIAALLGGNLDSAWARWSRPWTSVAWIFLTLGIALGSWWAYYELGWGGWWFWDPVENASFMPWLVATALIHSLAVTEKRGAFKTWTVLLAITAFSLSLLGTFLVRSGVLTSVHAFATDPERGVFILGFLVLTIGISLLLYAWRAPAVGRGSSFTLTSKESFLLANNVILTVIAATVLLGTLYPLFLDALGMGKISVGPPYFDAVFFYLMIPLVFALGLGPLARWKHDEFSKIMRRLAPALILSVLGGLSMLIFYGSDGWQVVPGMTAAFWIIFSSLQLLYEKTIHKASVWQGLRDLPRSFYGMTVAHLGVAMFIVGVTLTTAYSTEKDVSMSPGQPLDVGGYQFTLESIEQISGPNYTATRGHVHISHNGEHIVTLHPEKRTYLVQTMPMTEAGIDPGITRDLYVALGEPLGAGAWSMRVYHKPFVRWIWLGSILMALGGLLGALDKRYRLQAKREAAKPMAVKVTEVQA